MVPNKHHMLSEDFPDGYYLCTLLRDRELWKWAVLAGAEDQVPSLRMATYRQRMGTFPSQSPYMLGIQSLINYSYSWKMSFCSYSEHSRHPGPATETSVRP
ncbi:hypothetical protein H1C71_023565 [Ictidomys tridecemlineatus]|nr:hypothetical protein H1C71_023565 [Ictidomys tridecemlineatus]